MTFLNGFFDKYSSWFEQKFTSYDSPNSFASKQRRKRSEFFSALMEKSLAEASSIRILDIGGRQNFWEKTAFYQSNKDRIKEISLINIENDINETNPKFRVTDGTNPKFRAILGDGRNMSQFQDQEFDVVFSNSVIEHVGSFEDQQSMANEVVRVSRRYFVQTPNRHFPIEPHFAIPFFQYLPDRLKVSLLSKERKKWGDDQAFEEFVTQIRLISKKEMVALFPNAKIFEEKVFGLVKSFVAYDGWSK
jgi:ubiquinone/menaquinone biosynthesis C-methylase UbiE